MVARNFGGQELPPYVRLLQDDLLALEDSMKQQAHEQHHQQQHQQENQQHVYFDLNNVMSESGMYLGSEVTSHEQPHQAHEQPQHGVSQELMASAEVADSCCSSSGAVTSTRGGGTSAAPSSSRKRKASYTDASDDELLGDDSRQPRSVEDSSKKQNHSEIEKRRRDKMNTYITELSSMVPMCHAMSRKLDKLTVLRMAVQHLKTIRGAVHSYTEGHYKPAFLSDQELKHLILQAAEGFLFVVGCDRGRILYVSESVCQVLGYSQGDLLGQSWFDILHPKDVAKVKEQLSSSDLSPRERLIDAKTMLPVKTDMPQGVSRLCPGARRSFFCRMKCKLPAPPPSVKEEADTTSSSPASACHRRKKSQSSDRRYSVIQCTGYLKSWAPAKMGLEEGDGEDGDSASHLSCLVAVGRSQPPQAPCAQHTGQHAPPNLRTVQFVSRHALDGKFLFVDQRATLALGFLPQELLGTSMYEYYAPEDIPHLADTHKAALQSSGRVTTQPYRFRGKEGGYARVQSEWRAFCNPWTRDVECLVAKNVMLLRCVSSPAPSANHGSVALHPSTPEDQGPPTPNNFDSYFSNGNASGGSPGGREMTRLINSHVEASKIGRQIAEEALQDTRRRTGTVLQSHAPQCVSSHISHIPETKLSPAISCASPSTNIETLQPILHCSESLSNSGSYIASSALTRQSSHNVSLCGDGSSGEKEEEELLLRDMIVPSSMPPPSSPSNGPSPSNQHSAPSDGNDEAAMAVIMSLLEADAGLGGPVDFSGLPWPLP